MLFKKHLRPILVGATVALLFSTRALAAVHLWNITEVYTNADGTIQFIEFFTTAGTETQTNGTSLTSNSTTNYTLTGNLSGNTSNQHFLVATSGFAALSGAVPPDFVMPDNFIAVTGGDTLNFGGFDIFTIGSGLLPTDGVLSLNRNLTTGQNSPTNFAGTTGHIDLSIPPLDPDDVYVDFSVGSGGSGAEGAPFNSLQDAIDAANAAATINLKSGTTTDTFSGVMFPVISKELTLVKIPGGGTVIIGASARTENRSGFRSRPIAPRSSRSAAP